jgi:hypothetical protein
MKEKSCPTARESEQCLLVRTRAACGWRDRHDANFADRRLSNFVALFSSFGDAAERDLGAESAVGPIARIYIQPISIDALNAAMQMRVSFAPSRTRYGERLAPTERRLDW